MIDFIFRRELCQEVASFFIFLFRAALAAYGSSQEVPRWNQSCGSWSTPQPQYHQIQALSVTYTTAHGNAGSLTHWTRPGIEPTSSWILGGFVTHWDTVGTPIIWFLSSVHPIELGVIISTFCLFNSFCFLGPHLRHMEVLRLGVKSELQLPAYTTATATWDLSPVCNLHNSSWQHQILNPLIEARDRTSILMDTSWVRYPPSHKGNSYIHTF